MKAALPAADRIAAALAALDYAVAHDRAQHMVNALTYLGLAVEALGSGSLASAPEAGVIRSRAAPHAGLMARAAANLDGPLLRRPDNDGLLDSLFARSGYQALLDLGTWPEPPLDDFHLGIIDEDLADAVAAAPPPVPAGIPRSHRWWWPATG